MKIVSRGTVFQSQPGTERQSCTFPEICVLPEGRWVCTFRTAGTKSATRGNHVLLCVSDDDGQTWSAPVEPFSPPAVEGRPGTFRFGALTALGESQVLAALCWVDHSNPDRPFFNEKTEGVLDTLIFFSRSRDNGQSWSDPQWMDTSPYRKGTTCMTGPVLRLANGDWACHFELDKPYFDESPWQHASMMMFSADRGRSWSRHAPVATDPARRFFYWDQRPRVLPDGRILDLFWSFDRQNAVYINIHARESRDHGQTWSELWDTGVPGQPAPPVPLPDGRIGLVYVDRTDTPVIKLRISGDGGRTWPRQGERVISQPLGSSQTWRKQSMQDAWNEMGRFSIGLPDAAILPNGDVLAVYYAGPQTDHTSIEWVRIDPAGREPHRATP